MSQPGDIIINSVLCFLSDAKADYTNESLTEVAYSFYSHEEIKSAKVELANLLHKDIVWRRDPDKKRKDMKDVVDFLDELIASRSKVRFVTDTYKKMPPMGMELIAPILVNLSEQITRINEFLPKILEIKSEVLNSADTVRQLRVDVNDIKSNFNEAVSGLKEASNDICDNDLNILDDLRSFRQSLEIRNDDVHSDYVRGDQNNASVPLASPRTPNKTTRDSATELSGKVTRKSTGAISKVQDSEETYARVVKQKGHPRKQSNKEEKKEVEDEDGGGAWSLVGEKERQQRQQRHLRRAEASGMAKRTATSRVTGSSKSLQQLRAVKRTADVFLGRMDNAVSEEDIKQYVVDNFQIDVFKIEKLDIKTDLYNAFKITVSFNERDKLFNSELWPEDVIVDKFYNRSKKFILNQL